eukprot:g13347.t1
MEGVAFGNATRVKRALAAGARVDGMPGTNVTPLMRAATYGRVGMTKLLLEKGAKLEIFTPLQTRTPNEATAYPRGTRALHVAAYAGEVNVLRALLRAGAQPNVRNGDGWSPLMAACNGCGPKLQRRVTTIELLLEAGALPSLADKEGHFPLHIAAHWGVNEAIEVLAAAAPNTLNHANQEGFTPLCAAAKQGHKSAVRLLLSVGASDKDAWMKNKETSLGCAAERGHEGVTAVLLDAGLETVGGVEAVRDAMLRAIKNDHPRILDMLLGIEGEEMRPWWAKLASTKGFPMLMFAAVGCCLAATRVLLAAGAHERVFKDHEGPVSEIVGRAVDRGERDKAKEAALVRMLERGPAFRARTYCWPNETSAVTSGAIVLARSAGGQVTPNAPLGVRIFRPSSRSHLFMSRIARYTQKHSSGEA